MIAPRQASDVWVLFRSRIYEQARISSHDSPSFCLGVGFGFFVHEAAAAGAAEE